MSFAAPAPRRFIHACALGLLALFLCLPAAVVAEEVVLYRCTATDGSLTVQNAPCPTGTQQRIQRFAAPASAVPAPVPVPSTVTTAAAPAAATAPTAPGAAAGDAAANASTLQHAPLQVLHAADAQTSVEPEGTALLDSDVVRRQAHEQAQADAVAKAPLPEIYQCQGREGGAYLHEREPAPPHCLLMTVTGLGGNTPLNAAGCEVIRDACEPVADAQRCNSWQQRFRDARGQERFATPENLPRAAAERARLEAILADSDCPIP